MIALPDIILILSALLMLSMIAASVCRHLPIPYTVLLVVLGLLVNFFAKDLSVFDLRDIRQFHLTSELVFYIFLPALVFESALSLDARALMKNIVPILVLAVVGLLVSVILVGIGIWWALDIRILVALLFASLISATDPVAVVALFKELGASRRLNILVEGESLMNDATAIVLFSLILTQLAHPHYVFGDVTLAIGHFLEVFLGGIVVGICMGLLVSELLVRLFHGNRSIPVVLSLILAYSSFMIAEHELHVSGVMAVLSAAISINIAGLSRLSKPTIDTIHTTWEFITLICNSLLFILIGLSVDLFQIANLWQAILFAVIAVYIARAVSVYVLVPLTTRSFSIAKISWVERHIMWWGGLKGGLAVAMVMSIPEGLPEKNLIEDLTLGVVLVSILVNASTLRWLMHFLQMDVLDDTEQAELKQNMQQVTQSVDKVLQRFASMQLLDSELELILKSKLHHALDGKRLLCRLSSL